MFTFQCGLSITLCGENRSKWSDIFTEYFGNATTLVGNGRWLNSSTGSVDSEPIVIVSAKLDDITPELAAGFCKLANQYQQEENQEAVYIERLYNGNLTVFIVFAGEWEQARLSIDPLEAVLSYFSRAEKSE